MNKKLILIIVLSAALFHFCKSQSKLSFGFHGGINFNSITGAGNAKQDRSVLWINAGAHVKLNTSLHFGVKLILQYDQYGRAYTSYMLENSSGTGVAKGDILFKPTYLNLPVLAEYSTGKKIKFNVDAGLFAGILLSNQTVTRLWEDPADPTHVTILTSKSSSYKPVNFGLSIGTGIQVLVHNRCYLSLHVRDDYGLMKVYKTSDGKTNAFSIQAGLVFELQK